MNVPTHLWWLRVAVACIVWPAVVVAAPPKDPRPQRYHLQARASELDPRVKAHPEIDFVLEKDGKPADI
ncbi:MAG: hypothetical protein ACKOEM_02190 [Planctomycetia bacterium]